MSTTTSPALVRDDDLDAPAASEAEFASVSSALLAYTPSDRTGLTKAQWESWGPDLVRLVLGARTDVNHSRSIISSASYLLAWALDEEIVDGPEDLPKLVKETTIARYLAHLEKAGRPKSSRDSIRTMLRRIAKSSPIEPAAPSDEPVEAVEEPMRLVVDDITTPVRLDHVGLGDAPRYWELLRLVRDRVLALHPSMYLRAADGDSLPLGDVEVLRLFAAANQLKGLQQAQARLYLCLALGAGLQVEQMARVRGTDIKEGDDGTVAVVVRDDTGRAVREVVPFAPYAPALAGLASQFGDAPVLVGRGKATERRMETIRKNITRRDAHCVIAYARRLRNTWIAVHLAAGTPLRQLQQAAGLTGLGSFETVLPYVPVTGRALSAPWSADLSLPEADRRSPQQEALARTSPTGNLRVAR